jgi:trans-aconitate 2-methyltransferase
VRPRLACDLGCGPGWSTRLLRRVLAPSRTIGLDASASFIAEAGHERIEGLEFAVWDVTQTPFPVPAPNLLLCRFLLTHLRFTQEVLTDWRGIVSGGAVLLIHENESLQAENQELRRYYELVGEFQKQYGQDLRIGESLPEHLARAGWKVIANDNPVFEKPVRSMAELHSANIRTWKHDKVALELFDRAEIRELENALEKLASRPESSGNVLNRARQIVAVAD